MPFYFQALALWGVVTMSLGASPQGPPKPADFKQWGLDTLTHIRSALWIPQRALYAEEAVVGQPAPDKPAFMWGCGVQLSALAAAARLDRDAYLPQLRDYAAHLNSYWIEANGIGGYNVLPGSSSPDR